MFEKIFKKNKGITLITLVVIIIVLLILAGVSMQMLTGQNGIIKKASQAKEETDNAQVDELVHTSIAEALKKGLGIMKDKNLKIALNNNIGEGKYELTGEEINGWTITINGREFYVDGEGEIKNDIKMLPTGEGTKPYYPDEKKFEKVDGTDLDTGLVIKEKETGDEYVWIEVPKIKEVYPTAGINITEVTETEYKNIEKDLQTYTSYYRNGTKYSDVDNPDTAKGWFENGQYNELKNKMIKSVYQNGGFWVGRYEAGIAQNRTTDDTPTAVPVSKANMYPYTHVTRTQAKVLAEKVEAGKYTSSLLFGIQWDLMLKHIERKKIATDPEIKEKLTKNSTTLGNYKNNLWNITNKLAKYSTDKGVKFQSCPYNKNESNTQDVILTTGADESFSIMNIYDIAGNVWEWNLEKTTYSYYPCGHMGGAYTTNGNITTVSVRQHANEECKPEVLGFRCAIY